MTKLCTARIGQSLLFGWRGRGTRGEREREKEWGGESMNSSLCPSYPKRPICKVGNNKDHLKHFHTRTSFPHHHHRHLHRRSSINILQTEYYKLTVPWLKLGYLFCHLLGPDSKEGRLAKSEREREREGCQCCLVNSGGRSTKSDKNVNRQTGLVHTAPNSLWFSLGKYSPILRQSGHCNVGGVGVGVRGWGMGLKSPCKMNEPKWAESNDFMPNLENGFRDRRFAGSVYKHRQKSLLTPSAAPNVFLRATWARTYLSCRIPKRARYARGESRSLLTLGF